jgi:hypothetical protein
MDLNQLNIFVSQIKNLIEENISLVDKNDKLTIIFEQEQKKYLNILEQEKEKLIESENKTTQYLKQINELEDKISLLRKDNSEKSSKTIWETTQYKIKEKDEQIEELKKSVEFYKRKHTVSTRNTIDNKQELEPETKPEIKIAKNQLLQISLPEAKVGEQVKEKETEKVAVCPVIKSVKITKSAKTIKSRDNELEEIPVTKEKPVNISNSNKKIVQVKKKEKVEPLITNNLEDDLENELAAFN